MGGIASSTTFDIPKECIGGVVVNEGPDFRIEVKNIPVPGIKSDEVLIRMNCTGLCMSDVHYMLNDWSMPPMSQFGTQCAGHEGAGVIVKVGDRVKNLKVGQRAGVKPIADICHTCAECKSGREMYCQNTTLAGLQVDGSYKQYIKSPERYTALIPDGISDYLAGPVMCSASTIYSSLKESGIRAGNWACFPGGGGGVGIQGVQLATAMGIRTIVVDTGAEREELAKKMGAEAFVDFKEVENAAAKVVEITEGGAHAVFVTAIQSYPISVDYLGSRAGGVVMCIGLPPKGKFHIDLDPSKLVFRNQSVKGTLVSSLADIDATLEFAKRGKLRLEPTIVGISKFNESVQKLKNGQVVGRIVVDFNLP
ncbi:alcohol dehydrogenase 1 [Pseudomassariella vexata]|uniref:Alcohol dehydrogenase 1 n=1 Tax=Pseudomassariella vexata TaxID=1141098 RepID=A0A1Y2EIU0_9PEZI|nr:alcohol dehydrogenase 1 [Pseudomassariella vexata]ORY71491.1 alcohol dehydrogenase 1 [Pseudomassariella vexata]